MLSAFECSANNLIYNVGNIFISLITARELEAASPDWLKIAITLSLMGAGGIKAGGIGGVAKVISSGRTFIYLTDELGNHLRRLTEAEANFLARMEAFGVTGIGGGMAGIETPPHNTWQIMGTSTQTNAAIINQIWFDANNISQTDAIYIMARDGASGHGAVRDFTLRHNCSAQLSLIGELRVSKEALDITGYVETISLPDLQRVIEQREQLIAVRDSLGIEGYLHRLSDEDRTRVVEEWQRRQQG